jgi:hypothetical protein
MWKAWQSIAKVGGISQYFCFQALHKFMARLAG